MHAVPEDRARTVGMCKRLGIWPLDATHRDSDRCMCARCFGGEPTDELQVARKRHKREALPWELDAA